MIFKDLGTMVHEQGEMIGESYQLIAVFCFKTLAALTQ